MPSGYFEVEVVYKAHFATRVYAANKDEAKRRALKELEMEGNHIETLSTYVTADWEPKSIAKKQSGINP